MNDLLSDTDIQVKDGSNMVFVAWELIEASTVKSGVLLVPMRSGEGMGESVNVWSKDRNSTGNNSYEAQQSM